MCQVPYSLSTNCPTLSSHIPRLATAPTIQSPIKVIAHIQVIPFPLAAYSCSAVSTLSPTANNFGVTSISSHVTKLTVSFSNLYNQCQLNFNSFHRSKPISIISVSEFTFKSSKIKECHDNRHVVSKTKIYLLFNEAYKVTFMMSI